MPTPQPNAPQSVSGYRGGTGCDHHNDCFSCPFEDCLQDKSELERRRLLAGAVKHSGQFAELRKLRVRS